MKFAVLALVLVFTRPVFQSSESMSSASSVELVILIDDCLQSGLKNKDTQLLRQITSRAEEVVNLGGVNDRVTLVPLSNPDDFVSVTFGQAGFLYDRIKNTEFKLIVPRVDAALARIDSIFNQSEFFNRELYIISGFYDSKWDSLKWDSPEPTERRYILPVGLEKNSNVSIQGISIKSALLQQQRPLDVQVLLRSHQDESVEEADLNIYMDGERVGHSLIDIPANGVITHTFTVIPQTSGQIKCQVKLDAKDSFHYDNRYWFVIDIPDSIRVLGVAEEIINQRIIESSVSSKEAGFIKISWHSSSSWESTSFAGYDVLLLAGLKSISTGTAERIREFVSQGGGLVFFQGVDSDLVNLNRCLLDRLELGTIIGVSKNSQKSWQNPDLNHPVFYGVFDNKSNPRSPLFKYSLNLKLSGNPISILNFSDGNPLLFEKKLEKGSIMFYTIPLDPELSNFVFTGIFAPLILRSISYVNRSNETSVPGWVTGNSYDIILNLNHPESIQLVLPDKSTVSLTFRPVIGGTEFRVEDVFLPGINDIYLNGQPFTKYATNIPGGHSTFVRNDLESIAKNIEVTKIIPQKTSTLMDIIASSRFGRELWKPLAIIFLILLVSESIIGRSNKNISLTDK